jgi:hypothetical protein
MWGHALSVLCPPRPPGGPDHPGPQRPPYQGVQRNDMPPLAPRRRPKQFALLHAPRSTRLGEISNPCSPSESQAIYFFGPFGAPGGIRDPMQANRFAKKKTRSAPAGHGWRRGARHFIGSRPPTDPVEWPVHPSGWGWDCKPRTARSKNGGQGQEQEPLGTGSTLEALSQTACTFRPNPYIPIYARRTFQGVWRLDSVFSVAAVIVLRAQP